MVMKNIFVFLCLGLLITSCGDNFLDRYPSNEIPTVDGITTRQDVDYAVNGIYALLASQYYYGMAMLAYGDLKGDDMQSASASTGRDPYYFYIFSHSAQSPGNAGLWGRPWFVIRQTCRVLEALDNDRITDADSTQLADFKGQALALLGLAHFDLLRIYGYPYAKDNGASLGIPTLDHVIISTVGDVVEEHPVRKTVAESYDFIIDKFKQAIPLLSTDRKNGKINAYAARALLARVYLYCGKNQEAYDLASALIDEVDQNGLYQLSSFQNYYKPFNALYKFSGESLFEVAFTSTTSPGREGYSNLLHVNGYNAILLTDDYLNYIWQDWTSDGYWTDDRDACVFSINYNGENRYFLLKYFDENNMYTPYQESNYPVIRYSEVYLIAAEAGLKLGGEYRAPALNYLNTITLLRHNYNPDFTVTDEQFTIDRLLNERRREFIGEGHRYFDLLRNGKAVVRKGGHHLLNVPEVIDWNDYRCVLPIPLDEFKINPEIQQNPGYLK